MKSSNTFSVIPNNNGLLDLVIVIKIQDVVKIKTTQTVSQFDSQVKQIKDKISEIEEKK